MGVVGKAVRRKRTRPNTLATGCGGLQLDVPDLLLRIEGSLKDEADRVAHYLDASTRKPLIEIVEQNLLQAHNMQIVERGFEPLIVCFRHVRRLELPDLALTQLPLSLRFTFWVSRTRGGWTTSRACLICLAASTPTTRCAAHSPSMSVDAAPSWYTAAIESNSATGR